MAFVTGAGGFLGGAVASALQAAGWRIATLGHAPRTPAGIALTVEGPISAASLGRAADALERPELVFHAAGGASVGASVADPDVDRARTVASLEHLLGFLEDRAPRARLIYPSSAAVYGAAYDGPIPETAPLAPISPYGVHKAEAERLIAQAAAGFGLQAVILRFFSIYGPGLRKQLLWELAGRLADAPAEVKLAGGGDELRDFLHVSDALALIGLAATAHCRSEPLILNGASGQARSVRQIAEALARAMAAPSRIVFSGAVRAGDPKSQVADIGRARAMGFEPAVPLEAGLRDLAAWFGSTR